MPFDLGAPVLTRQNSRATGPEHAAGRFPGSHAISSAKIHRSGACPQPRRAPRSRLIRRTWCHPGRTNGCGHAKQSVHAGAVQRPGAPRRGFEVNVAVTSSRPTIRLPRDARAQSAQRAQLGHVEARKKPSSLIATAVVACVPSSPVPQQLRPLSPVSGRSSRNDPGGCRGCRARGTGPLAATC